jgi:hypothetical protein
VGNGTGRRSAGWCRTGRYWRWDWKTGWYSRDQFFGEGVN